MAKTTLSTKNATKPAPKWWRKLENGLLMILIPAAITMLLGFGYEAESKSILIINVGVVALIKFIGYMLANGEIYTSVDNKDVG